MPTTTINLTGQALSKVDDTNVTLTLGGTPLTALLKATSLTLGWTGTLADARITSAATWNAKESALTFSTGLTRTVNTITIDNTVVTLTGAQALSNKTGLISQWTNDSGYLTSLAGAVTSVTGSGNIASSGGATPNITFTGVLPAANGGTATNILTTALALGTASSVAGQLTLQNATNAFTQTIRGTNPVASITYDLPTTAPTAGQVLQSTAPAAGIATLSWATASSGITVGTTTITSGTSRRIPYNLAGVYQEAAQELYFELASPYAHVFAAGRTGVITGVENTVIGFEAGKTLTTGARNVFVGYQAVTNRTDVVNCVVIGSQTTATAAMDRAVVIGYGAFGATSTVSIGGESKNASQNSVSIGYRAAYGVALGGSSTYSITIGSSSNLNFAYNSAIAIGYNAQNTATNQGILGSNDSNGYISNWYFNGVTHTAAYATTLNACGGSGTSNAAASLTLAGGKSTGSAAGGSLLFKTSTTLASGTTLQSLVTRLTISGGAVTTDASTATWADALDFVFGSTTGTKIGTATTQKIGFWNATPIVQPTTAVATSPYTHVPSTAVHEDSTFDGYKLGQVVKALREVGILA